MIVQSGKYPKSFKLAIVTPISKTKSSNKLDDLRPISILSTYNKIVEKFLYDRILKYVLKFNLMSKNQFGFRPKSNTESAAMELVSNIRQTLDKKKIASVVFMDIRKAFDIVDRKILMKTLNLIGLRGNIAVILESYLTKRFQVVRIGRETSLPLEVIYGVIQGSVLGSLLFNLYFNGVTKLSGVKGRVVLYADDLALINEHEPKETVTQKITNDMKAIMGFLEHQKMLINSKKTNFMIFHSPYIKCEQPDVIQLDEAHSISRIATMKYLGLNLDPYLKWDVHGECVAKKLSAAAGALWKLKKVLPMAAKLKIYHSLFASHINYMINIWGNACDTVISPIQIIQNRVIRNIYGFDRLHGRIDMFKSIINDRILPIRAMNFLSTASFMFLCQKNAIHSNFEFERNIGRRSGKALRSSATKNNYGKKDIHHFGVNIYNSLPTETRNAIHIHAFKFLVRQYVASDDFLSCCFDNGYLKSFG